jgi:hypothetical protein
MRRLNAVRQRGEIPFGGFIAADEFFDFPNVEVQQRLRLKYLLVYIAALYL